MQRKIEISIPAMPWTTYNRRRRRMETALFIGGYVAALNKAKREVREKAEEWKKHCFLYIDAKLRSEGWSGEMFPSFGFILTTQAFFAGKKHFDTCNVHKGIEDILVYRRGKSPKGTFFLKEDENMEGHYMPPKYDKMNPRLIVVLEGDF